MSCIPVYYTEGTFCVVKRPRPSQRCQRHVCAGSVLVQRDLEFLRMEVVYTAAAARVESRRSWGTDTVELDLAAFP